ncbi:MAG TPA: HAD-IIIA family hydrolase [Saprospiraceae bacterium]|nr:HAD-IIIA family hydrolase [Saprospiraceae bacterium]HMQ85670.1 HAD-IIIA family hydrolase [Saprospiraceae bacterium]
MNHLEQFASVKTFFFDVDGVLTNNQVLVTEEGHQLRSMNVRDGYAIRRAVDEGYRICIISGGSSEGVRSRLQKLGIEEIHLGVHDKIAVFESLVKKYDFDPAHILYMGDDLPDYKVMRRVGLPVCPADSAPEIFSIANYVSPYKGGEGCVRDVIEKVLRLNGHWAVPNH